MGRPKLKPEDTKKIYSIRLNDADRKFLLDRFETLQKAINAMIKEKQNEKTNQR